MATPDSAAEGMPQHKYLIDACSINEVDGAHRNGQPSAYSPAEQELIWGGLLKLFESGRARMVSHARRELSDLNPEAHAKIRGFRAVQETNRLVIRYQDVTQRFPQWVDEDGDPADPWMVAYAAEYGWRIVTEEKRQAEQRIKRRHPKIPDAADFYKVPCVKVDELIRDEGWLT